MENTADIYMEQPTDRAGIAFINRLPRHRCSSTSAIFISSCVVTFIFS